MKKLLGLCFFLFSILTCFVPGLFAQETFNVGYRVVDFKYWSGKYEEALTVAVWYPTAAQPKPYTYAGSTSGNVAINAAPYAGRGPYQHWPGGKL